MAGDPRALREHLRYYAELGVTGISRDAAWRERVDAAVVHASEPTTDDEHRLEHSRPADADARGAEPAFVREDDEVPVDGSEDHGGAALALEAVRAEIGDCTRCKLHTLGRHQVVFGVGNPSADLMFVGEAPGGDEDLQGVPFVGRAGQLLTKIIEAMGYTRDQVYIANVIKCRPPGNRNPEPDEVDTCEPFLFRQVDIVKPRVIVALGTFAAKALLRTNDPISRLRGQVFDYRGAKLIPTFHPAFLLRSPERKRDTWDDMKIALGLLGDPR